MFDFPTDSAMLCAAISLSVAEGGTVASTLAPGHRDDALRYESCEVGRVEGQDVREAVRDHQRGKACVVNLNA